MSNVQIEESWKNALAAEFEQPYFAAIKTFLLQEKEAGKTVYPPGNLIFNAFNMVPLDKVRVVILGQDPYHKPGEAHGLSFSVQTGVKVPPSLAKIYKELESDIPGFVRPTHGNLEAWAHQGVFLLNAYLTVVERTPNSHSKIGWERFTNAVIKTISDRCEGVVFMLWGKPAQTKSVLVDDSKHLILKAAHPSPLAGDAFLGCKHFSQANTFLTQHGHAPINWNL